MKANVNQSLPVRKYVLRKGKMCQLMTGFYQRKELSAG
jgi:hypothetical protein